MDEYNPFSLQGKVVLVTGASSGIGRATAIECSKLGANVVVTALNVERLNETFQALKSDGAGHLQIVADLTVDDELQKLVETIPRLDGVACNAGTALTKPVSFVSRDDFDKTFQTNLLAPIFLTKQLVRKKKLNRPASIVYTAIDGVFEHAKGHCVYGTSKSALDSFMKYAALEYSEKGIRCNCVNPGMTDTPLIHQGDFTEEQLTLDAQRYLLKRYGNPQEIAWAIVYLLSDASAWVTGTSLKIDGGISLSQGLLL